MSQYSTADYAFLTKAGFFLGVGLLVFGFGGEVLAHALLEEIPSWEDALFTYSEGAGIIVGFFSVVFFGIYMPLTE